MNCWISEQFSRVRKPSRVRVHQHATSLLFLPLILKESMSRHLTVGFLSSAAICITCTVSCKSQKLLRESLHDEFLPPFQQLERSFQTKAHSEKFMNVSDMQVPDEEGLLSRSMMINAKNIIMKERIWINAVPSEITLQPLDPDTDTPSCTRSV